MKVLLLKDVDKAHRPAGHGGESWHGEKLGWVGSVVEVSDGYARNYLFPQGLAVEATEDNIRSVAKEKARHEEMRKTERERLEQIVKAVEGAEVVIAAQANEQGHLFGSVGVKDIAANLREQRLLPLAPENEHKAERSKIFGAVFYEDDSLRISDRVVQLISPIKQVGQSKVPLKFAEDLTAEVEVVVVSEGQDVNEIRAEQEAGLEQSGGASAEDTESE